MYEVTLWPILAAGVANLIIGFIWYHPSVLGTTWMQLTGLTPAQMEAGKKKMPVMMALAVLAAVVMAYVMAHIMSTYSLVSDTFDFISAIDLAFWMWIGFIVPVSLGVVLWEGKSATLFFINSGYWLVSMIVASIILVL